MINDKTSEKSNISDALESQQQDLRSDITSQNDKDLKKIVTVNERIYRSYKSAHTFALALATYLLGMDKDDIQDLNEVRKFQEVYQALEISNKDNRSTISLEVNYEDGKETELIEIEKLEILD